MRSVLGLIIGAILFVGMARFIHFYFGVSGLAVSFGVLVVISIVGVGGLRFFRRRTWKRLRELRTMRRETAAAMAGLADAEVIEAVNELFIDERQKGKFLRQVRKLRRDGVASDLFMDENPEIGFKHDERMMRRQRRFVRLAIRRRQEFESRMLHALDVATRVVICSLAVYAAVSAIYLVWQLQ